MSRMAASVHAGSATAPAGGRVAGSSASSAAGPAADLVIEGVGKSYGAVTVLSGADIRVAAGTIHAFVGENGAGKSTMLGAIAGRIAPSEGSILLGDTPLGSGRPRDARAAGVAAVYQELTVLPALSAMDNVFLGAPPARAGWLARGRARSEFLQLRERFGVDIAPDVPAGRLSVAQQQMLEIMRAIRSGARLILLDEPTASLAAAERRVLLGMMQRLRARGISIVFVSHNLDEVLEVCDEITVFRNGRVVESAVRSRWDYAGLVRAMLGDRGQELAAARERSGTGPASASADGDPGTDSRATDRGVPDAGSRTHPGPATASGGEVALGVSGLTVPGVLHDIRLELQAGEILGVGGLVGSGRSTLLRALAGAMPRVAGEIVVDGRNRRIPRSVPEALNAGLALVPEERKKDGLVMALGAAPNIVLSRFSDVSVLGWIVPRRARAAAARATERYGLPARMLDQPVGTLSGGNQQKVLLARWAHRRPRVLLADEPARGIDLGAKAQIFRTLREYTESGGAVLMVSSENDELLAHADRILVMAHGRIVADLDNRRHGVTEHDLLDAAFDSAGSAVSGSARADSAVDSADSADSLESESFDSPRSTS